MDNTVINQTFNRDYEFKEELDNGKRVFVGCGINNINFANVFENEMNDEISFKNCIFDNANFENVTFKEKVVFENCTFKNVSFRGAIFEKDVEFKDEYCCFFYKTVNFSETKFEGETYFKARFIGKARFSKTEFKSSVDFSKAKFEYIEFVDFIDGIYSKDVDLKYPFDFSEAKFNGNASFSGTHFYGKVNFSKVKFNNDVSFNSAKFENEANFSQAKFRGSSDFGHVEFRENVNFESTNFDTAYFIGAKFVSNPRFVKANFSRMWAKYAKFDEAEFDLVEFKYANVSELFTFKNVSVRLANFYNATIGKTRIKVKKDEKEGIVIFRDTIFLNPEEVIIHNFKPSKFSFLGTRIEGIQLIYIPEQRTEPIIFDATIPRLVNLTNTSTNSKLYKIKEKIKEIVKKVICEKSERLIEGVTQVTQINEEVREEINEIFSEFIANNPNEVENKLNELNEHLFFEYKSLRKVFENNKYYVESSSLFKEEMKMLREKSSGFEKFTHYFYAALSCYGESILRPFILMLIVIFIIPALLSLNFDNKLFLKLFVNVTSNFFQIPRDLGGCEIPIRLAGAITLGLLFIAFRRRFERK